MVFAMKGGGLEGVSSASVLHLVWDSYYVYIVVEVTLNMAK